MLPSHWLWQIQLEKQTHFNSRCPNTSYVIWFTLRRRRMVCLNRWLVCAWRTPVTEEVSPAKSAQPVLFLKECFWQSSHTHVLYKWTEVCLTHFELWAHCGAINCLCHQFAQKFDPWAQLQEKRHVFLDNNQEKNMFLPEECKYFSL